MQMRVKILEITKALYGNRSTGFGIVIGSGLSQIKIQHFVSESQVYEPEARRSGSVL